MNYFRTLAKNGNWPKSEIIYYPFNIKKDTSRSGGTFQAYPQPKFSQKMFELDKYFMIKNTCRHRSNFFTKIVKMTNLSIKAYYLLSSNNFDREATCGKQPKEAFYSEYTRTNAIFSQLSQFRENKIDKLWLIQPIRIKNSFSMSNRFGSLRVLLGFWLWIWHLS